jgi:predicted nucleic acid-binding protein
MIILDTNVISELMKPSPTQAVIDWINQHPATDLFITAITLAEISYGIQSLPAGNRRTLLEKQFADTITKAFSHRILSFDDAAALHYGKIMANRKASGKPLGAPDGQIAAIVYAHEFTLATRNVRHFVDCGLEIINPFG